jgi:hypothetical protein
MDGLSAITARVISSATISDLLEASFDAFEVIRLAARACEDQVPELFAAFMVAATTAAEGRHALNDAPSLPPARSSPTPSLTVSLGDDADHIADVLAELATLLAQRLHEPAGLADLADDRDACERAGQAATDIHQILSRDTDETAAR